MLHDIKVKLSNSFSIDFRGKMTWFLGCNVEQSHSRISPSSIKDILRKSHMSYCEPVSTLAIPLTKQSKSVCPIEGSENSFDIREQKQYLCLVENLMCLSVVSRPYICFAVYNLAQFVSNPWTTSLKNSITHSGRFENRPERKQNFKDRFLLLKTHCL